MYAHTGSLPALAGRIGPSRQFQRNKGVKSKDSHYGTVMGQPWDSHGQPWTRDSHYGTPMCQIGQWVSLFASCNGCPYLRRWVSLFAASLFAACAWVSLFASRCPHLRGCPYLRPAMGVPICSDLRRAARREREAPAGPTWADCAPGFQRLPVAYLSALARSCDRTNTRCSAWRTPSATTRTSRT